MEGLEAQGVRLSRRIQMTFETFQIVVYANVLPPELSTAVPIAVSPTTVTIQVSRSSVI